MTFVFLLNNILHYLCPPATSTVMKLYLVSVLFLLSYLMLSCSGLGTKEQCETPKPLNPNGDSELALLMREMFDEGMRMREQILNGEKPRVLKKFEAIHTAQATEPEKANSDAFEVMADVYLASLKALKNASEEERYDRYQSVVQSCMSCHQAMCPGPMVRIKKMYLPEKNNQ